MKIVIVVSLILSLLGWTTAMQVEAVGPLAKALQAYGIHTTLAVALLANYLQWRLHEKYRDKREAQDAEKFSDLAAAMEKLADGIDRIESKR